MRILNLSRKLLVMLFFATIPAMALAHASDTQMAPHGQTALKAQLQKIRTDARTYGIKIESLTVRRNLVGNDLSGDAQSGEKASSAIQRASCTVSGSAIINGTKVTITATASNCVKAAKMVADGLAKARSYD